MEHFRHPRNYGEISKPSGIGKITNKTCGDIMWLYIKVGKSKTGHEIISDIKFKTFGCPAAIATSSVLTQMVKGKCLDHAASIKPKDVIAALDGLPPIKLHCSLLGVDALRAAIADYKKRIKAIK